MRRRAAASFAAVVALASCVTEQGPLTNRMSQATTGYLSRAARQPVRWQPWGSEAFALAARLDRPVLLVVGADRCQPCAEMDRVWEDPALASLVNALFVPVRVDRDERPDVAHRYRDVVRTLSGVDGYPLTVFLTTDGAAFFGGTTFPADDPVTGRGLRQILPEAARSYREKREAVESQAAAAQALADGRPALTHGLVGPATVSAGIAAVRAGLEAALIDGTSPIPVARGAELLFAWFGQTGDSAHLRFARRLVDPRAAMLASAADAPALRRAAELRALVRGWVVTGDSALLAAGRQVLAAAHADLPIAPDAAVFTDVTAFVIGTVLLAGPALGDSVAPIRAQAALDSLLRHVYARDLGARHQTVGSVRGLLDDQAQLAGACVAAYRVSGASRYLEVARELVALIERDYGAPLGGYFDTALPDPAVRAVRTTRVLDNGLPGANAWVATVLLDLAQVTGEDLYRRRADAALEAFAAVAADGGLWAAGYFDAARTAVAMRGP